MKKERGVWIYVDPSFRQMLKVESAKRGDSMVNLTRKISKSESLFGQVGQVDEVGKIEKKRFHFRI